MVGKFIKRRKSYKISFQIVFSYHMIDELGLGLKVSELNILLIISGDNNKG